MSGTTTRAGGRPGLIRRHKVLAGMAVLLVLLLVIGAGALWYANNALRSIDRFASGLRPEDRATKPVEGPGADALNILLLGTDKGSRGQTVKAELDDGEWSRGAFRSDTIMILHIPADRDNGYLISIPRDSYVQVPDEGKTKINAAFSYGGPDLAVHTIEQLTGVYLDHVAILDWAGFKELTNVVGGVPVTIAETYENPRSGRIWQRGTYTLQGEQALRYVRTRYGLAGGDFDRIKRQQNFLRATMRKTLSRGTLTNPLKLKGLLNAASDNITVDSDFTAATMRGLARQLGSMGSSDVTYLTVPVKGVDDIDGVGSVVLLDEAEDDALWKAVAADDVQGYLDSHEVDRLGDPRHRQLRATSVPRRHQHADQRAAANQTVLIATVSLRARVLSRISSLIVSVLTAGMRSRRGDLSPGRSSSLCTMKRSPSKLQRTRVSRRFSRYLSTPLAGSVLAYPGMMPTATIRIGSSNSNRSVWPTPSPSQRQAVARRPSIVLVGE